MVVIWAAGQLLHPSFGESAETPICVGLVLDERGLRNQIHQQVRLPIRAFWISPTHPSTANHSPPKRKSGISQLPPFFPQGSLMNHYFELQTTKYVEVALAQQSENEQPCAAQKKSGAWIYLLCFGIATAAFFGIITNGLLQQFETIAVDAVRPWIRF